VVFVAPPEKEIEWTDAGLEGSFRFLARVWRLVDQLSGAFAAQPVPAIGEVTLNEAERALRRKTHDTIRRVTLDLDPRVHLNTAVSAQMELVNELYAFCNRAGILRATREARESAASDNDEAQTIGTIERGETRAVLKEAVEALVLMLSPFTPHMCEELWEQLGHGGGVVAAGWPAFDEAVAKADEIVVPVQVNGKVRARLTAPAESTDDALRELALGDAQVVKYLDGKTVRKVVVAGGQAAKLVSIVVS
jgi:leucyl-tRNA synthetase